MKTIKLRICILILSLIVMINCLMIDVRQPITIYYNSWVTRFVSACCQPINGITLGRNIFIDQNRWYEDSSFVLEHELVHIQQIEQYSVLGFYTIYLAITPWYGYENNPYEVEATKQKINLDISKFSLKIFE